MIKKIVGVLVVGLVGLGSVVQSEAALMQSNWTAAVSHLSLDRDKRVGDIWDIGDEITWSVIYDDSNMEYHNYGVGDNGIGEFGENDDTILNTYTCSPGHYCSDAILSLDSKTTSYLELVSSVVKNSRASQNNEQWIAQVEYYKGNFGMTGNWSNTVKFGQIFNWNIKLDNDPLFIPSVVSYQITQYTVSPVNFSPVPEPATMVLFGVGLLSIVSLKFKCKKK